MRLYEHPVCRVLKTNYPKPVLGTRLGAHSMVPGLDRTPMFILILDITSSGSLTQSYVGLSGRRFITRFNTKLSIPTQQAMRVVKKHVIKETV